MKKLICIALSLMLLLSLAACQSEAEPTDAPTNAPTNAPTDAPTDPTDAPTEAPTDAPTDAPTEPTEPAGPAEMPANGYCAVGIVNSDAGTAKVLADNGAIAEIPYTSEVEIVAGSVYAFAKNGDVYTLSPAGFLNADYGAWGVRTIDGLDGGPDQLYTHDGINGTIYDLTEDCVVFCRFSDTEYRIFRGSDAVKIGDWPCYMYFTVIPPETEGMKDGNIIGGTTNVILVVGDPALGAQYADEATTYFFDEEGFGWSDGDLIIE